MFVNVQLPFLDIVGYISAVTSSKRSAKQNSYFDIEIQTTPAETEKRKRKMFLHWNEQKSSVKLTKVSVSRNLSFFNSNSGSRMEGVNEINFKYSDMADIPKVKDDVSGSLTIIGFISWSSESKEVFAGPNKI